MVETRLVARLCGVRVLRVDGVVLLSPARLVEARRDDVRPARRPAGTELALAARLLHGLERRPTR